MHHRRGSGVGSGWRWSRRQFAATVAPSPFGPVRARSSASRCRCAPRWTRRRDRMPAVIRVLVVEDEPVAAEAHRTYVDRTPGFATAAVAATGALALDALARTPVDLVLLDMNLPDTHGIELCRRLRAAGADVDVLAVTSARELTVVRAAAAHGVVGYLLKPFTYAALRDRLAAYADYRDRMRAGDDAVGQEDIDRAMEGARPQRAAPLPKGMHRQTLDSVVAALRAAAAAEGHPPPAPRFGGCGAAGRRRDVGGRGRRADRRLQDHGPPLPLVPPGNGAGQPDPAIRRHGTAGDGIPLAVTHGPPTSIAASTLGLR